MKHLKIVEQIPSVDVLKTMEKPYVLLEKESNKLQYNYVEPPTPPSAEAGDIVYKTSDGKFKASKASEWNASLGTAVGVCVIPTSHDVYGDGSCAILSLSQATSKQWGGYGTDITELTNYIELPIVNNIESEDITLTTTSYGFLPSDRFNNEVNQFDNGTGWASGIAPSKHMPSVYTSNGKNTDAQIGALSDFDGINNTSNIVDTLGNGDYAAKVASEMTDGGLTWYLPAMGELAYIMPRFNQINEGLSKVGTPMGTSVAFWSSSEYNGGNAWYVDTLDGFVGGYAKDGGYGVLGFARVLLSV